MFKKCIVAYMQIIPCSCQILMKNWNFIDRFSKNTQKSNFMKIPSVGAELFYAGGRTDRETDLTKLLVAFRNFAKAPRNRKRNKLGAERGILKCCKTKILCILCHKLYESRRMNVGVCLCIISVVTQNSCGISWVSLTTALIFVNQITLDGLVCKIKSFVN